MDGIIIYPIILIIPTGTGLATKHEPSSSSAVTVRTRFALSCCEQHLACAASPSTKECTAIGWKHVVHDLLSITMLSYPIAPLSDSSAAKNRGLGVEKVGKKKLSEWGLPGVENVPTSLESLFKLSRGP